jgi:hypothetical protein
MDLTYQQVLADHYDENAKDLLVYPNITTEEVPPDDKHPDELENQEEFQKFGGSHAQVEINPSPLPLFEDKTTLSVKYYSKDTIRYVYTLDSRFRQNLSFPTTNSGINGPNSNSFGVALPPKIPIINVLYNSPGTTTTNFTYTLPKPIKNIASVKLLSVEIPNTAYEFAYNISYSPPGTNLATAPEYPYPYTGNTMFKVAYFDQGSSVPEPQTFIIPDGNYDAQTICSVIQTLLNTPYVLDGPYGQNSNIHPPLLTQFDGTTGALTIVNDGYVTTGTTGPFLVDLNLYTGKVTISTNTGYPFSIQFVDSHPDRQANFGLGYNLGFIGNRTGDTQTGGIYGNGFAESYNSYTGEKVLEVIGDNYYLLQVADWNSLSVTSLNGHIINAFAKIPINQPKFGVIYQGEATTISDQYWFRQPTNVSSIPVTLINAYGDVINLHNMNMSLTVELVEILNPSLYEYVR